MNNKILSRLEALELTAVIDLPPVFCIGGSMAPASLWNRGTTREQAEGINTIARDIHAMLNAPTPNRRMEDFI